MRELICITCPMGCHLTIDADEHGQMRVTGNRCARGEHYAHEEMFNPKRVVTFTCAAVLPGGGAPGPASSLPRRVPVRTTTAFPKEKIPELLAALRGVTVGLPVVRGTVVLRNALGTGVDVVVTRSVAAQ
jgi:CxxC motif-containing protein